MTYTHGLEITEHSKCITNTALNKNKNYLQNLNLEKIHTCRR